MEQTSAVIEYKCPCCDAGLAFSAGAQQLSCEYCGNSFEIDAVRAFNEGTAKIPQEEFQWEEPEIQQWSEEEQAHIHAFTCPSCGAVNKGKFCPQCGAKKPADAPLYRCDKCGWEPEDPAHPPKFCPECGDRFDGEDIR